MHATRGRRWPLVLVSAGAAMAVALSRELDAVEVRGLSMAPSLLPGDRLFVRRQRGAPRVGDIVIAGDPRQPTRELIKRVVEIGPGGIRLRGDNPRASTDGRSFGSVPQHAVNWRVVLRYWPPDRIGKPARAPATGDANPPAV